MPSRESSSSANLANSTGSSRLKQPLKQHSKQEKKRNSTNKANKANKEISILGLDTTGFLSALVVGGIVWYFAGLAYLTLLFTFLLLALYITSIGYKIKVRYGVFDYARGWQNVASNGLIPFIAALLSPYIGSLPFIASVAGATADKFASELGILGGKPIELFTWKRVKPGKSGAISLLGTFFSFVGALTITFAAKFLFPISSYTALLLALAGFTGSLVDSIAGYFEERGLGTKETSNFICTLTAFLLAFLIK